MTVLNIDDLADIARAAFEGEDPNDLAFMFATGKSEGYLRDALGAYMNKNLKLVGSQHVTREWKKHDLAIMDGNSPLVLIEGKSWICHDAYRKTKLLRHKSSILNGALGDSKKLLETKKKYPNAHIFITTAIYGVKTDDVRNYEDFNITYGDSHSDGIKSAGSFEDLVSQSRTHATTLHQAFGSTRRSPISVGRYRGMQVEADFFISAVEEDPRHVRTELERQI